MGVDLRELAKVEAPSLKVSGESKPQSVAKAIQHVWRESPAKVPPSVSAIGPNAINQAIKAIAIARRQGHADGILAAGDLTVRPVFENLSEGSNVELRLGKSGVRLSEAPEDNELSAKNTTDTGKLAGAIAGRIRESQRCSILVKGAVPVLIAVKAIAKAQEFLAADKSSGVSLAFTTALVDRENRALRNAPTSTFTQLTILALPAAVDVA